MLALAREAVPFDGIAVLLRSPEDYRAHLKEARARLELKDYDAALATYTKFIDKFGLEDSCRY